MKTKKVNDGYFKNKIFCFRQSVIPFYMVGKRIRVYMVLDFWFRLLT